MKWRITISIGFFGLLYLFLISNLYNIQFNKNTYYEAKAEFQQRATGVLNPSRGVIYFSDKNNNAIPAVLNKDFYLIYAVPKEIETPKNSAVDLSRALGLSADDLEKKFKKANDLYEVILYKADQEQVKKVKDLDIKGIYIKTQVGRFYPFANLASQMLGFVSPVEQNDKDGNSDLEKGRYGLESFFEDELRGQGGNIKGDKIVTPKDGSDLNLTIDVNIQAQAEDILKELVDKWDATQGSVIVEDPKTGRILTMGSYPSFDPNEYSKSDVKYYMNPATQMLYEPGSVFKILTMAAGIDSGKITPDTTYVDKGYEIINGRKVMNWDHKVHGRLTMTNVIEQSINTGTIFAERQTGHETFKNYLINFGLNAPTNIKLPGELKGNLSNLNGGREVNYATASYGQGVAVTPIEMINAASAIANKGVLMRPLILANEEPEVIRRVISEDTAHKVTQMMVSAVRKNVLADIPNYNVAGKTGTAFIPDFGRNDYTDQVVNTYIGFAPAFDPKFIILIKLERPHNAPLAGQTVVPAFRELAEYILNYYNITPDNLSD